jgi:hypothetical protein
MRRVERDIRLQAVSALVGTSRGQNKAIAVSIMAFDLRAYKGAIWSR